MRPAGDRSCPADLPGRPACRRSSAGSPRSATTRSRHIRRWRCSPAGSRCSAGRRRRRSVGRPSSMPPRSTWSGGWLRLVRVRPGDAAGVHVCPRSRADAGRRDLAVEQEPPGVRGGTPRSVCWPRPTCCVGDVDQAAALFDEASSWQPRLGNIDTIVRQRSRARPAGDGPRALGRGGRPARAWRWRSSTSTGCTTTRSSVLAFAAAARLALHRGDDVDEADRQLTRAMRARPSCTVVLPYLAVRLRLQLAMVYQALGDRRPLVTCCARSTTSCCTGQPSARSSTRFGASASTLTASAQAGATGGLAADPGRAASASVPADAPDDPRDRRAALRLAQHGQLRGPLDLPQARRLLPHEPWSRPRRSACSAASGQLLDAAPTPRRCRSRPPGRLRGAATTRGSPTTGRTPTSTSTISARSRPHRSRRRPCTVGRHRAPRPRRARPAGPAPASWRRAPRWRSQAAPRVIDQTAVVDGQPAESLDVVQGHPLLSAKPKFQRQPCSPLTAHRP